MHIGRIEGATRVLGKCQGYLGLPVRDVIINCTVNGDGTPAMETAWLPTPEEIERIIAGAAVRVRILGTEHPPIMVDVGDAPVSVAEEIRGRFWTADQARRFDGHGES